MKQDLLRFDFFSTTLIPVRYVTLPAPPDAQLDSQLMLSSWAWGSTRVESMANLGRLIVPSHQSAPRCIPAFSTNYRSQVPGMW